MSKWQRCPICGGNGIDPYCVASTSSQHLEHDMTSDNFPAGTTHVFRSNLSYAVPTRFSNPCHRCNGSGTIIEPDTRPRCADCGKTGWFAGLSNIHFCNAPADDEDLTNEPPWKF